MPDLDFIAVGQAIQERQQQIQQQKEKLDLTVLTFRMQMMMYETKLGMQELADERRRADVARIQSENNTLMKLLDNKQKQWDKTFEAKNVQREENWINLGDKWYDTYSGRTLPIGEKPGAGEPKGLTLRGKLETDVVLDDLEIEYKSNLADIKGLKAAKGNKEKASALGYLDPTTEIIDTAAIDAEISSIGEQNRSNRKARRDRKTIIDASHFGEVRKAETVPDLAFVGAPLAPQYLEKKWSIPGEQELLSVAEIQKRGYPYNTYTLEQIEELLRQYAGQ